VIDQLHHNEFSGYTSGQIGATVAALKYCGEGSCRFLGGFDDLLVGFCQIRENQDNLGRVSNPVCF
jgi:hypothetical protein